MDSAGFILGWTIGLGLGALIAVLLPILGLVTLVWLLVKRKTRRAGALIAVLAAATVLTPAPWIPWHPALALFDRAALLACYFLAAVIPWSAVIYLAHKVRRLVASGA